MIQKSLFGSRRFAELSVPRRIYAFRRGDSWEEILLNRLTIVLVLLAIALGSTIIALASRPYFGRLPFLALLGQILATGGAAAFALNLRDRH